MLDDFNILRVYVNKIERVARGNATTRHKKHEQYARAAQAQPFNKIFHSPLLFHDAAPAPNFRVPANAHSGALRATIVVASSFG